MKEAVPRIARKQADQALQSMSEQRSTAAHVHEARTSVKKLRGLLRLVKPALGEVYPRENQRLRKVGASLSRLRDAEVLLQTFDSLLAQPEQELPVPLRRVRSQLTQRLRGVEAKLNLPARLREATKAFRETRKRAQDWVPHRKHANGWKLLVGGLGSTYRWGRRAMDTAYRKGEDAAFHDWRKAVKYHGYHMRLLADMWPEQMNGRLAVIDELGTLLGQDHDLSVFAETLRKEPRYLDDERERERLLELVRQCGR